MKRMDWIKKMFAELTEAENANPQTIGVVIIGSRTVVMNLADSKIGVATCSPTDDFDTMTGAAIAYARMLGKSIPQSVITGKDAPTKKKVCVSTLKGGQKFVYDGNDYIYCGVDSTTTAPDKYLVHRIKDGLLQHFWSVNDGGDHVEIEVDD